MSVTIESLDIQIRSSAGSAAASIEELARALGSLRSNAKLTAVTNNLSKLNSVLLSMRGSKGVMSNLTGLSRALISLSSVSRFDGLRSAITQLKKIPEVVEKLDSRTVGAFADSMRKLATAMAPLAYQIDKIGTGFSKLPKDISKMVTGVNRLSNATNRVTKVHTRFNKASINLAANLFNLRSAYYVVSRVKDAIAGVTSEAIEWEGISQRFGRAFGEDAEDVLKYIQKINDALDINIQTFMQYSSLYGSLLKGFGLGQEQVTTMSVGLTELSYDIWAAYNDRYKTLEDASEAVRSAITGEIEPIRNAGIALTEASLQEYLDSVGMATISIEKLTEAQKAEVRYAAMVSAAMKQGIVGTYANEMMTAEGAVRTLSQQLATLGQTIGSLIIPVLSAAIPWVQAFVEILTDAVHWLASLLGIELFKIDWTMNNLSAGAGGVASGLDEAADSAKELKKTLLGIDELNVLQDPNSGGKKGGVAGGGSLGLDLDTLWNDELLNKSKAQMDEIKEKLKEVLTIAGLIAAAFLAWKIGTGVVAALPAIKTALSTVGQLIGFLTGKAMVLTASAMTLLSVLKFVGVAAVLATLVARFVDLYNNSEKFRTGLERFGDLIGSIFELIGGWAGEIWNAIKEIGLSILDLFPESWKQSIMKFFEKAQEVLGKWDLDWKDLALTLGGIALFFVPGGKILGVVVLAFEAMSVALRAFGGLSDEEWAKIKEKSLAVITAIKDWFVTNFQGVVQFFTGVFTRDWRKCWDGLKLIAQGVINFIGDITETLFGVDIIDVAKDWFERHIKPWFTIEKWRQLGQDALDGIIRGLSNFGNKFSTWATNVTNQMLNGLMGGAFGSSSTKSSRGGGFGSVSGGLFASGGFPITGEMFIAREAGPELVGRIGNRSAVVNNDQIVEGISYGVQTANEGVINAIYAMANAIVNAVESNSGTYLDGRAITNSTTNIQNRQARMYNR